MCFFNSWLSFCLTTLSFSQPQGYQELPVLSLMTYTWPKLENLEALYKEQLRLKVCVTHSKYSWNVAFLFKYMKELTKYEWFYYKSVNTIVGNTIKILPQCKMSPDYHKLSSTPYLTQLSYLIIFPNISFHKSILNIFSEVPTTEGAEWEPNKLQTLYILYKNFSFPVRFPKVAFLK